jgi:hypothetical protein
LAFAYLAGLLPRVGHQVFLLLLNHARAERCGDAFARVEVELVEPRARGRGATS